MVTYGFGHLRTRRRGVEGLPDAGHHLRFELLIDPRSRSLEHDQIDSVAVALPESRRSAIVQDAERG